MITRRNLLTALPGRSLGAGAALLAAAGAREALAQTSGESSITSNFNGTDIPAGDWIWFTSVMKVKGLGSAPVTLGFMSSIQFNANGVAYIIPVPPTIVTFSPAAATATTVSSNGQWVTVLPLTSLSGNVFLAGAAVQAPVAGFPGGINPVTWQGTFTSMTSGLVVNWQWAAAVYAAAGFGSDYTLLGVKPVDDNQASIYQNSDHAGTPEFFKSYVIGGARGGGGSNFTGSYSATAACVPIPAQMGGGGGC